ncbi:MAG TPA: hypothetical protein VMT00_05790 [Thermoanaerobaculia bacterium]|nr:hypothetical protein [Thermoanaerobaculia bacterium]
MRTRATLAVVAAVALFGALGCRAVNRIVEQRAAEGPKVRAKVLTIRTTIHPEGKALLHQAVFAGDVIRLGSEVDHRRLFNVREQTVTFVDDIEKTYRTVRLADLVRERQQTLAAPMPVAVAPAQFVDSGTVGEISGFAVRRYVLRLGSYHRELWLSQDEIVPEAFFPLMISSEPISEPFAGVMGDAFRELIQLRGYPVLDQSRMKFGDQTLQIERKLEKVEEKMIPAAWVQVPREYRNLDETGS